ncbi:pilus assembly PilX family protein [Thiothrix subterranea]|uniref:PilX N-terminal domain-containing pilus assembly protein n=1 Tax=Thiothrix subterranea TaxID=2735563 RepID=A0AA51R6K7_9GAMM|nr:PilX N-terminal domain-containing pilus assembly protein [Thiothrix subterranea]MDQ5767333.1 PilX N-terminal domain-containing pilus assembly protein [Thiothrix subterranea]WML88806.1 PilX N-terminal domain-containing pilus assembly protein [Thiothrix subterranea]
MQTSKNQQQGAVLVWGMVILLTLTVIGIAATRMATVDSRIAGNQMMYMLTFQGADSMLNKSRSLYEVMMTVQHGVAENGINRVRKMDDMNATKAGTWNDGYTENTSGVAVTAQSSMGDESGCPPLKGIAMTTEMTPDAGGIACRVFTTNADASLSGTGAQSTHSEGVLKPVPKLN